MAIMVNLSLIPHLVEVIYLRLDISSTPFSFGDLSLGSLQI